ncbi:hypothetical protein KOR34_51890 [Posidoniimonas corsicana]|uniref:HD domain-containing protein n=1 Tax=Posidoniimonas corsicana TaxID=1938618 RepID=A0A5C5UUR8_9BACT|nr:hypothetical protein [Posidoniimonas corsicana]TWT29377.1 hypothetical protein KOR34_51890 [Posidoniimonas corsicana]
MSVDYPALCDLAIAHFSLGDWSLHGPNHWRNVEINGRRLCRLNGADETVVRLFALFHDIERRNEGHDPDHGRRAADLVQSLHGDAFQIEATQLLLLLDACRGHNDGLTTGDLTIGTCWDADRLDLPRVGIRPDAQLMSTHHGKLLARGGRGPAAADDAAT